MKIGNNQRTELDRVSPADLHKSHLLHNIYLGLFKHMMEWVEGFLKKDKRVPGIRRCLERNSSLPRIHRTKKGLLRNHKMPMKGEAQLRRLYLSSIGVRIAKSGQFSGSGCQEHFEVCYRAGILHSHGSISQSYTRHTFLHGKLPADIPLDKGHFS